MLSVGHAGCYLRVLFRCTDISVDLGRLDVACRLVSDLGDTALRQADNLGQGQWTYSGSLSLSSGSWVLLRSG